MQIPARKTRQPGSLCKRGSFSERIVRLAEVVEAYPDLSNLVDVTQAKSQEPIEKTPEEKARDIKKLEAYRSKGINFILIGFLFFIGGSVFTCVTYMVASNDPQGGTYANAWGAIACGLFYCVRGFFIWKNSKSALAAAAD